MISIIKKGEIVLKINRSNGANQLIFSFAKAKENKGQDVISLNVGSKPGNEFIKTKRIENLPCCNNITDNGKLRKGRNRTYADVVSGSLDLSTEKVAFDTPNNDEVNFVKKDDIKKGIDLNCILANLEKISPQHPTSSSKLCSDTSTSNNSSDCFNK